VRAVIVNLQAIRCEDFEEATDNTIRAALDPREVIGAATYEEMLFEEAPPQSVAFVQPGVNIGDGDDIADPEFELVPPEELIPEELRPKPKEDPSDTSTLVLSRQNKFIEISQFEKALAIYVELTGMSRGDYTALRETLFVLRDTDGNVLRDVEALPKQLSTLRDRMRKRMPLMNMREVGIPLKVEKLPTEAAKSKGKGKGKAGETETVTTKLTFFDPPSVIKNFVGSDIFDNMHQGPAIFVDAPHELFHSHAWASSVRTTCGRYAHIPNITEVCPVFPSDFIYYRCLQEHCHCQSIGDEDDEIVDIHIGRVYGVGFDHRRRPCSNPGELVLQIQECLQYNKGVAPTHLDPAHEDEHELLLVAELTYIPESKLFAHVPGGVYCDYTFGEIHENPTPASRRRGKAPTERPKYQKSMCTTS
jgi:hypothetical protein